MFHVSPPQLILQPASLNPFTSHFTLTLTLSLTLTLLYTLLEPKLT